MIFWFIPFCLFQLAILPLDNLPEGPGQAAEGPGSGDYITEEIWFQDYADKSDGFWLFEPMSEQVDTASVIVFNHGYGAINPMVYGGWIRHLVQQGHIVIYPRYQRNLFSPSTRKFVDNATYAIKEALELLKTEGHVYPDEDALFFIGHSYGGAISANILNRLDELGLPKPKGALLCAPGTGPFKGGLLDSYENLPESLKLLIVVSINDYVVGEKLGRKVYETAINTPERNLIRIIPDSTGNPALTSEHNECYSLDMTFDTGLRNVNAERALRIAKTDAADYYCFWKLMDALMDCTLNGANCEVAIGDTPEQQYMGAWSNGTPLKTLEIWKAENKN
ncbi:MAG: alpha/beta hydrolase fold domain-containing protein [Chitinophagales bacterium]|nr:alpha/beta hydrolase fold domain-containing protein [Chitinophagales bacterium]